MLTKQRDGVALVNGVTPKKDIMNKKIKVIRNTVVDGEVREVGWTGETSLKDAVYLMQIGRAIPHEEMTKKKTVAKSKSRSVKNDD